MENQQPKKTLEELEKENEQLLLRIQQLEDKNSRYVTRVYEYVNEEQLKPPYYVPTAQEIKSAKAQYAVEEEVWDIIHNLKQYIEFLENGTFRSPYTPENLKQSANASLERWDNACEQWNDKVSIVDALVSDEWFKAAYVDPLSEIHAGDCTAIPASCMRCHAEGRFGLPYTAKWSKAQGYQLYMQYIKDWKEKNNE